MKLVILTTQTPHHAFYVQCLAQVAEIPLIVVQTQSSEPPFPIHHPSDDQCDRYERDVFFSGEEPRLATFGNTLERPSVNDELVAQSIERIQPDLVFDFGTGKVAPHIINLVPNRILNMHGGDPEHYRGLDSHLWAIYHGEFDGLVATVHRLNAELDDGEIVLQASVPIPAGTKLHQLRRYTTEVFIELSQAAVDMIKRHGRIHSRPQRHRGRYYSFMPAVLKSSCVQRFEKFTHQNAR